LTAGKTPNANQRERRLAKDVDKVENELATAIGQAVAGQLAQLMFASPAEGVPPLFHQVMAGLLLPLKPQKTACVYCAARRKMTIAAGNAVLKAAGDEHAIAVKNALDAAEPEPEFTPPELPELPGVQEACTWVPVVVAKGYPPCSVPVCFDDLPESPAADVDEPDKPAFRQMGLVDLAGRPILAPNAG
jgi:hypothetical protein